MLKYPNKKVGNGDQTKAITSLKKKTGDPIRISMPIKIKLFIFFLFYYSSLLFSQPDNWEIFTPDNSGISDTYALSIAFDDWGNTWVGTKYGGLCKYNGSNWEIFKPDIHLPLQYNGMDKTTHQNLAPQVNGLYDLAIDQNNVKWIGTKIGGLFKFDGFGWTSFTTKNSALPNDYVWSVIIDRSAAKWLGTIGGGVAVVDGYSWQIFSKENSPLPNNEVWAIAIDQSGCKWFGTTEGLVQFDGTSWQIFNRDNSALPVNKVLSIAIDNNDTKWIGTSGGGLIRFDGRNWHIFNQSNSPLPDDMIWSIAIDSSGLKWIGTIFGGVAKFDNHDWEIFNTENSPLLNNTIWDIQVDPANNVWLGTNYGLAVYRQNITTISHGNLVKNDQIDSDKLLSCFPNPFNNFTQIRFFVSQTRRVKITIFNITGNFVYQLTDRNYSTGIHHVFWNGQNYTKTTVPSGKYFCRFETDDHVETRCITFLK